MHLDVLDLRQFYYRTRLGRAAQKSVRDQVVDLWPEARGQTVVGYGFAVPLLRPYLKDAARVIGLMPGAQGVMPWPAGRDSVSVLCHETRWPLAAGTVDKLIVLHGLETSRHSVALLEECFRVLAPEGKALFIVPNRRGLWARRDVTPFGFGRPYSLGQLETELRGHGFEPERHRAALFAPPSHARFWLKSSDLLERLGRSLSRDTAGGVVMLEAAKHTFAPPRTGLAERVKRPLRILDSAPQPAGVSGRSSP